MAFIKFRNVAITDFTTGLRYLIYDLFEPLNSWMDATTALVYGDMNCISLRWRVTASDTSYAQIIDSICSDTLLQIAGDDD